MSDDPFPSRTNPVDPALSADVGREKARLVLPIAIGAAILLSAAVWWFFFPHGPKPPLLTFESRALDCTFTYSSRLVPGPNFVRAPSGSLLTIERHSLLDAKKDWVAGLPDILFQQVLIQINESYADVQELSRTSTTVGGRKALEVTLSGESVSFHKPTILTITIFATDDWVYVLRTYAGKDDEAADRPLFEQVRSTWRFLHG
jgi:hypothetical protein